MEGGRSGVHQNEVWYVSVGTEKPKNEGRRSPCAWDSGQPVNEGGFWFYAYFCVWVWGSVHIYYSTICTMHCVIFCKTHMAVLKAM